jgi:hypothetical protein
MLVAILCPHVDSAHARLMGDIAAFFRELWALAKAHPVASGIIAAVTLLVTQLLNSLLNQLLIAPLTRQIAEFLAVGAAWATTIGAALMYLLTAAALIAMLTLACAVGWLAARNAKSPKTDRSWFRSPLRLCFEPCEPYVMRIRDANTWPKGTSPANPERVKTDTLWFRVLPVNERQSHIARGVRVFLTGVEKLTDETFVDLGIATQMQLRWAADIHQPFDPRDIRPLDKFYVDVLSVGDQHNRIFVKWPPDVGWLANETLFEKAGIYRLTIAATTADGVASEIKLGLLWSGRWDQTAMWADGAVDTAEVSARLASYLVKNIAA